MGVVVNEDCNVHVCKAPVTTAAQVLPSTTRLAAPAMDSITGTCEQFLVAQYLLVDTDDAENGRGTVLPMDHSFPPTQRRVT